MAAVLRVGWAGAGARGVKQGEPGGPLLWSRCGMTGWAQSDSAEEAGSGRLLNPEVEPAGQVEGERKQFMGNSRVSRGRKGPDICGLHHSHLPTCPHCQPVKTPGSSHGVKVIPVTIQQALGQQDHALAQARTAAFLPSLGVGRLAVQCLSLACAWLSVR